MVLSLKTPLESAPTLADYSSSLIDKTTLEVEIKKGESVNTLFELLSEKQIKVLSMRNKSNRLEQLFLHLVKKDSMSSHGSIVD
jgi:ABC-2 type transport system ATP-binding protein